VKQVEAGAGTVKAIRNMEGHFETVEARLPAVIAVTSGINTPRIPSLMQILRASKKPMTELKVADILASPAQVGEKQVVTVSNLAPVEHRKMVVLEGATDDNINSLVNSLVKEGVLRT